MLELVRGQYCCIDGCVFHLSYLILLYGYIGFFFKFKLILIFAL